MWVTTKGGKRINTDWFDQERQIVANKAEADERNKKQYTPLYHGSDFKHILAILESDELRANVSNETETYGVSTTRNKDTAYDEASIVLDKDALKTRYKVYPIYRESIFGRDLAEERVDKTIAGVSKYIREIRWNDDSKSNIKLKLLRRMLVENFDNSNYVNEPHHKFNDAYYIKRIGDLAKMKGIRVDARFQEALDYISRFENRVFDTERWEQMQNKVRNKKRR